MRKNPRPRPRFRRRVRNHLDDIDAFEDWMIGQPAEDNAACQAA